MAATDIINQDNKSYKVKVQGEGKLSISNYTIKPNGSQYAPGETIKLPTLARTLHRMVDAERAAKSKGRAAGIASARDLFYKGDLAREMVAFLKKNGAPFAAADFAEFFARHVLPGQ